MRGKEPLLATFFPTFRITPAYAGKRYLACVEVAKIQDHPRLCGEKSKTYAEESGCHRITPAYAGKSATSYRARCGTWDHPRLCGEKFPQSQRHFH